MAHAMAGAHQVAVVGALAIHARTGIMGHARRTHREMQGTVKRRMAIRGAVAGVLLLACAAAYLGGGCGRGDVAPEVRDGIAYLESWDLAKRQIGARRLSENPDPAAVPALVAALDDEDAMVREYCAEALGRIGDSRAAEGLARLLQDEDPDVRWRAAEALGAIAERPLKPLLEAVVSDDRESRRNAAGALAKVDGMKTVAPVLGVLQGGEFEGDPALKAGVESLSSMLSDPDVSIRRDAAEGLGALGTPMAITQLLGALDDEDPGVRWRAAEALGSLGDKAVPKLVNLLKSPDGDVRWGAATALGIARAPDAVPELVGMVGDPDLAVSSAAVGALGNIWGPGTRELITTLDSADESQRAASVARLMAIEDKDVAGQILRASLNGKTYYRTLGSLEPHGAGAGHLLYAASLHESGHVRQKAAYMLLQLGHELAVKATVNAMVGEEPTLCRSLAIGLRGQLGERAIAPLVGELGREDKSARYGVAFGLAGFGETVVEPVVEALKSGDATTRLGAAETLGMLRSKAAIDPLIAALDDASGDVRAAVAEALKGTTGQDLGQDAEAWRKWRAENP